MADETPQTTPFSEFIIMQAQSAGLFLGQIPHPHTGETSVNLDAAKGVIDAMNMLQEKTKGNLTEGEAQLIETALSNLTSLYENVSSL